MPAGATGIASRRKESGTTANDTFKVQVLNTAGAVLATLATCSDTNAASGYVQRTLSMTPCIGKTVTIKFVGFESGSKATAFVLDDVTLSVQSPRCRPPEFSRPTHLWSARTLDRVSPAPCNRTIPPWKARAHRCLSVDKEGEGPLDRRGRRLAPIRPPSTFAA